MIAVARKGLLEGLNAHIFELGEIQIGCWYRFALLNVYFPANRDSTFYVSKVNYLEFLHVQFYANEPFS